MGTCGPLPDSLVLNRHKVRAAPVPRCSVAPHHTLRPRMVWAPLPFYPGACASRSPSWHGRRQGGGNTAAAPPSADAFVCCPPAVPCCPLHPCTATQPGEAGGSWGSLMNHITGRVQLINLLLILCCLFFFWGYCWEKGPWGHRAGDGHVSCISPAP